MTYYRYQVVSGAGILSKPVTLPVAKEIVLHLRPKWPEAEIERIKTFSDGSKRYWRWRNCKWSTENHYDPKSYDLERWE